MMNGGRTDTNESARQEYERRVRAMPVEQKIRAISNLSEELREMMIAGVLSRHPEYDSEQARQAVVRHLLGDDLFRAAYPAAPLLQL